MRQAMPEIQAKVQGIKKVSSRHAIQGQWREEKDNNKITALSFGNKKQAGLIWKLKIFY